MVPVPERRSSSPAELPWASQYSELALIRLELSEAAEVDTGSSLHQPSFCRARGEVNMCSSAPPEWAVVSEPSSAQPRRTREGWALTLGMWPTAFLYGEAKNRGAILQRASGCQGELRSSSTAEWCSARKAERQEPAALPKDLGRQLSQAKHRVLLAVAARLSRAISRYSPSGSDPGYFASACSIEQTRVWVRRATIQANECGGAEPV